MAKRGVFCLEGDWLGDLKKPHTVEPMLALLRSAETYRVPYIHRNVATLGEFEHYVDRWAQIKHADYPVLYLAFHGVPGAVHLGAKATDCSRVDLDWFEERLAGRCKGRIIYFGSCLTMNVGAKRLREFLERTGALAACGYREEVYWMRSTAFELLFLAELQYVSRWSRRGVAELAGKLRRMCRGLHDELRFRIAMREDGKEAATTAGLPAATKNGKPRRSARLTAA